MKSLIVELGFVQRITARVNENSPIVKIFAYDYIETKLYYVMEIGKYSLDKYWQLKRKKDDLDRNYMIWTIYPFILKALLFLESIRIAHRDIKPQNFLVFDDNSNRWGFNTRQ